MNTTTQTHEAIIARAHSPQVGDLYARDGMRLEVTATDAQGVSYRIIGPNVKITADSWSRLSLKSIERGAQFTPMPSANLAENALA